MPTFKEIRKKYEELVQRGLERECQKFLVDIKDLSNKPIEEKGKEPYHNRFEEIYKLVKGYDRYIGRNYEFPTTPSINFDRVFNLYHNGILTEADINELGETEVSRIKARIDLLDELNSVSEE